MNAAALITAFYPPAIRDRWGPEITTELKTAGPRSWPDAVTGAVRLWLHPSTWPETSVGQTRRVTVVTFFVVTSAMALLLRATGPPQTATADTRHLAAALWLAPTLLGTALATPLPPLRRFPLRPMTATAFRTLAAPATAFAAMVLAANTGLISQASGPIKVVLVAYYWCILTYAAAGVCLFIARIAKSAVLPPTRRLSTALVLLGAGLTCASLQNAFATMSTASAPGPLAATVTLALLAAATTTAGRDMRPRHN